MAVEKAIAVGIFEQKLGKPSNEDALSSYLDVVLCSAVLGETTEYTEVHHIFPRCMFGELSNETEYQVRLRYEDHVKAHVLLAEAYPIRKFIRPLNYMASQEKNRELLSLCTKNWWKGFKPTDAYVEWNRKRTEWLKSRHKGDKSHIILMAKNRHESAGSRERISEHFKSLWKNDSMRDKILEKMRKSASSTEGRKRRSTQMKNRWKDKQAIDEHRKKMSTINKDETKRKVAGKKIKELWKDPAFREKVLTARMNGKKSCWWNDGKKEVKSDVCPDGYVRGRLKGRPRNFRKNTT